MKMLVTYDIANDKLRTQFSKFLEKFGHRKQYSVFEMKNSQRILNLISHEIETTFGKKFKETDSVLIYKFGSSCQKISFGYPRHDDEELIIVG